MAADGAQLVQHASLPSHQVNAGTAKRFVAMSTIEAGPQAGMVGTGFDPRRQWRWRLFLPLRNADLRDDAFHPAVHGSDGDDLTGLGEGLQDGLTIQIRTVGRTQIMDLQAFVADLQNAVL